MTFGDKARKAEPVPIVADVSMTFDGKAEKAGSVPLDVAVMSSEMKH